ncbi:MAG: hypothetical protein J6S67_25435 [Methanobrevibacter sp.]|nr:hypothetical protein [Methanobrevibacter sp.]
MSVQEIALLNYLMEHKEITGLEALTKLGIMSYTKRISCLRERGVVIKSEWQTRRSRFGLKRFVKYVLLKVPTRLKKDLCE